MGSMMPLALVLLAATLAATVLAGPLGFGVLQWRVSAIGLNQTWGADGASLVLAVPVALVSAWLWRRRSLLAPPLALGAGVATLYYAVASVMGADYTRYPGNNERFFLLLLTLIVLSWTVAARAWTAFDASPPLPARWLRICLSLVLLLGGAVLGFAWVRQLLEVAVTGTFAAASDSMAYADAPSAFWIVRIVDLGFIVPVCLATAYGMWRGSAVAIKAAYGVCAFLVLQATSVLTMGMIMLLRHDPTATPSLVIALAPVSLGLVVLTAILFASAQQSRGSGAADRVPAQCIAARRVSPDLQDYPVGWGDRRLSRRDYRRGRSQT
jgi:hypothetical protein